MRALVISKPHVTAVENVPYPEPGPDEITIHVRAAGICGTDFSIHAGEYTASYPIIPGHEFSGVIDKLGGGVNGWMVGDRVTVDPSLFCGRCSFCVTGRTNQCSSFGALGVTVPGALAEYVRVPAEKVFKLPEALSFTEGAFVEPMACVVHGMNRLQLKMGDRVLVFGAGSIGQLLIQTIAKAGVSELVAVDVSETKLALAKEFGATNVVLSSRVEEKLHQERYQLGFDVVIEATGFSHVIEQALNYLGPAGKYLQFGVAPRNAYMKISPFDLYHKDWTLLGSMAINQTFLPALRLLAERRVNVAPLVSKTLELEELPAFLARQKEQNLLKVHVQF